VIQQENNKSILFFLLHVTRQNTVIDGDIEKKQAIVFYFIFKVYTVWPQIGFDHAKNNE